MAEAYLIREAAKYGLVLKIDSAGTNASPGMRPPPEALERLYNQREAYENHAAKPITPELLEKADAIFVMEEYHRKKVTGMLEEAGSKIYSLVDFDPGADAFQKEMGIPDPMGMSGTFFDNVSEIIDRCCVRLAELLREA